jgi:predicted dehydrogenase
VRRAVTAVPFVYRFYPAVREARARLEAGEAGRLWLLHGSYLQDWLANPSNSNWRVDPTVGGGSRAFGDIGVHWCDLMEFVTGHRITRLTASTARAFEHRVVDGRPIPVDTEDGAALVFETDRGALGTLVVSQVSPGRKNRLWFSFEGTGSSFEFDQEQPETLRIGDTTSTRRIPVGPDLRTEQGRRYAGLPAGHPQGYQDAFNAFTADAFRAVRGEEVEGLPTFADGLRAARITDAVLASAATGGWVDVGHPVDQRSRRDMEHR